MKQMNKSANRKKINKTRNYSRKQKKRKNIKKNNKFLSCRASPDIKRRGSGTGYQIKNLKLGNMNGKMIERLNKQITFAEKLLLSKRELEGEIEEKKIPEKKYYMTKLLKSLSKKECLLNKKQFFDHFLECITAIKYSQTLQIPSKSNKKIFYPWVKTSTKKLLVLDLDETLIHSEYQEPKDCSNYQIIEFTIPNKKKIKVRKKD